MQLDFNRSDDSIELQEGSIGWKIATRLKETSGFLASINNRPNHIIYDAFKQLPLDVRRLLRVYMEHEEFPSTGDFQLSDSIINELHRLMYRAHDLIYHVATDLPTGDKPYLLKRQLGKLRGVGLNIKDYTFRVGMLGN